MEVEAICVADLDLEFSHGSPAEIVSHFGAASLSRELESEDLDSDSSLVAALKIPLSDKTSSVHSNSDPGVSSCLEDKVVGANSVESGMTLALAHSSSPQNADSDSDSHDGFAVDESASDPEAMDTDGPGSVKSVYVSSTQLKPSWQHHPSSDDSAVGIGSDDFIMAGNDDLLAVEHSADFNQDDVREHAGYISKYKALVCKHCKAAVSPVDVRKHARNVHSNLNPETLSELVVQLVNLASKHAALHPAELAVPLPAQLRVPVLDAVMIDCVVWMSKPPLGGGYRLLIVEGKAALPAVVDRLFITPSKAALPAVVTGSAYMAVTTHSPFGPQCPLTNTWARSDGVTGAWVDTCDEWGAVTFSGVRQGDNGEWLSALRYIVQSFLVAYRLGRSLTYWFIDLHTSVNILVDDPVSHNAFLVGSMLVGSNDSSSMLRMGLYGGTLTRTALRVSGSSILVLFEKEPSSHSWAYTFHDTVIYCSTLVTSDYGTDSMYYLSWSLVSDDDACRVNILQYNTMVGTVSYEVPVVKHRRYVRYGSAVDAAPRVTSVILSPLRVENLKCIPLPKDRLLSNPILLSNCPIHDYCDGHLEVDEHGHIGVPPMYLSSDPSILNSFDKLNRGLHTRALNNINFAVGLRNEISVTGASSVACMRGVGVCHWDDDPSLVYVPKKWTSNLRLPHQVMDSRQFAPAISEFSVQAVRIRPYDGPAVRIHASMCDPLNGDFDGDEYQVAIFPEPNCVNEIKYFIGKASHERFSKQSIADTRASYGSFEREIDDFMLLSTVSVTSAQLESANMRMYNLCGVKDKVWTEARKRLFELPYSVDEYEELSKKAITQMAESHVTVPDGFVLGRQLKHLLVQTNTRDGIISTDWCSQHTLNTVNATDVMYKHVPEAGYPGMKLALAFSNRIMQSLLDLAKGRGTAVSGNLLLSFLSESGSIHIGKSSIGTMTVTSDITELNSDQLSMTSSRSLARTRCRTFVDLFAMCMKVTQYGCRTLDITPRGNQLYEFSHMLYTALITNNDAAISSVRQEKFMSTTDAQPLPIALADDSYSLDILRASRTVDMSSELSDNRNAMVAIALSSFDSLYEKSPIHVFKL
ncbi:hypothetical protein DFJ73DRAFT_904607 [Zopfochytrium polystomum]|nr:hypothetical protein DFJ73DRAFT_904607 [Zopfochytrium polystomum]